jgi:Type II/IV secretion system protein
LDRQFLSAVAYLLLWVTVCEIFGATERPNRGFQHHSKTLRPGPTAPQLRRSSEVRGGEAFDLLQLLNTGHSGTLSTIHANSARQGLARFTSCVLQNGVELPYRAIKTNIADSLNVVVHIECRPGRRFISEVLEITGYDPDADLYDFGAVYAEILRVPNSWVYERTRRRSRDRIPGFRLGKYWRFGLSDIKARVKENGHGGTAAA